MLIQAMDSVFDKLFCSATALANPPLTSLDLDLQFVLASLQVMFMCRTSNKKSMHAKSLAILGTITSRHWKNLAGASASFNF